MKITLDSGAVVDVTKALADKEAFMANNPEMKYCGELMRKVLIKVGVMKAGIQCAYVICGSVPSAEAANRYNEAENMRVLLNEFRMA